jgi:hypothetical protein
VTLTAVICLIVSSAACNVAALASNGIGFVDEFLFSSFFDINLGDTFAV